ncbi:MAG: helix-turn-helix transcriptional regulator [Parvibaculum sp.]|uniref:helix-turn-helix domain-containing protein n=1 Tax=Parvibaculum sp. TaxID=2024848 RepID=UPI0025FE2949|nr:helix-turn-helix transcriptional regulator [Parvibaculum sp.]MCE9648175.1 helix-turn-helix transcriptional regulator [Parvibaculum sp.]
MPRKSPNPIDVHVGGRVRMRRMLVGMSQEKLGDSLGLTFQQVQKYEKGANRIGASRLYQIARVLGVPIEFFYDGVAPEGPAGADGFAEAESGHFEMDMLSTAEGIQLNSAFFSIRDPKVRKKVLELVKALGDQGSTEDRANEGDGADDEDAA